MKDIILIIKVIEYRVVIMDIIMIITPLYSYRHRIYIYRCV